MEVKELSFRLIEKLSDNGRATKEISSEGAGESACSSAACRRESSAESSMQRADAGRWQQRRRFGERRTASNVGGGAVSSPSESERNRRKGKATPSSPSVKSLEKARGGERFRLCQKKREFDRDKARQRKGPVSGDGAVIAGDERRRRGKTTLFLLLLGISICEECDLGKEQ